MTEENIPPVPVPVPVSVPAEEPTPTPTPVPDVAGVWPSEPPQAPAPGAPRGRRRLALGTAAALVAVAAAGGVGYTVLHHGGSGAAEAAPSTAATPWKEPAPSVTKAFGARSGGSHYGSLALLLLPVPDNYGPGPDVDAFGNDVVLDAHQAQDLVKGDVTDLPAKERKAIQADVDALRIEGAGLRTYTQHDNQLVIQMEIVQMKNKDGARAETRFFTSFTKALGVFRSGPKISGHPQATCVLPPKEHHAALEEMYCQATEGDLMVKMTASGTLPLEKAEAADLLHKQLDRVRDPGQAV
ncbi:hypothetical protein [Actinacidiphila rubida]|uniref:Uncharacterized protein n=1 Tax=Actinacidiphila rubida TaxID=310780 RepID=A0A1H8P5D2_9ACTN|nr:hypothetical protein [Actinacidiphila rubida]SEO36713.1 hypothetical protein SAMN05216267_1024103 [Actinacidiphila rubida]